MYEVERISSHSAFAGLKEEWGSLHRASNGGIFAHHAFLLSWAETYGRRSRLDVVLLRDAGRLVGALPLFDTGKERAHAVMGEGRAGLAQWLLHPDIPDPEDALAQMLRPKGLSFLRFEPLEAADADLLQRAAAQARLRVHRKATMRACSINIDGDFATYLKSLKAKTRQKYNRSERKLLELGVTDLRSEADGRAALDGYIKASNLSWKAISRTGLGATREGRAFLSALLERLGPETCRLAARIVGDEAISGRVILVQGNTWIGVANDFNEAYSQWNVGRNSILQSVLDAFEAGAGTLDFSRCNEMLREVSNSERDLDRILIHRRLDPAVLTFFAGQAARRVRRKATKWKKGRRSVVR